MIPQRTKDRIDVVQIATLTEIAGFVAAEVIAMRNDAAAAISSIGAVRHNAVLQRRPRAVAENGPTVERAVAAKGGIENRQCPAIRNGAPIPVGERVHVRNCIPIESTVDDYEGSEVVNAATNV